MIVARPWLAKANGPQLPKKKSFFSLTFLLPVISTMLLLTAEFINASRLRWVEETVAPYIRGTVGIQQRHLAFFLRRGATHDKLSSTAPPSRRREWRNETR